MEESYRFMLMACSGQQRLKMGCSMFETARALQRARVRDEGFAWGTVEWKLTILMRTYGDEISPEVLARIREKLIGASGDTPS